MVSAGGFDMRLGLVSLMGFALLVFSFFSVSLAGEIDFKVVITSYSIHYTKLYETRAP